MESARSLERAKSRKLERDELQQAYPARTITKTYSLIQRMQEKASRNSMIVISPWLLSSA